MAVAVKIPDLNVVDIDTHKIIPSVQPGMAGVAIITKGQREGLQTYSAVESVAKDYDPSSYVYKFANIYFNAPGTTTLQVITYPDSAPSAPSVDPYNFNGFKSAITSNLSKTTSSEMFESIKGNFGKLFTTGDKSINKGLGDIESNFASGHPDSGKVNNDLSNVSSELNSIEGSATSNDPAVNALIKYYDCGAEYFVFLVSQDNENTAIDLSNEVEGQSEHNLILDIPTANSEPDFSWLDPIKNNLDTAFLSLPFSGDPSDYQLAAAVLAQRAPENPAANLQFINNLNGVQPQDKYNFTPQDLNTYYKPYGVITYCYRNEIPMLSSGNSADGYQMSNVVTRDYLNMRVSNGVTQSLIGAHNSGSEIHYDAAGIQQIQAEIKMILDDAKSKGYIENYNLHTIDVNRISEATKESGQLSGLGYDWQPINNINHVEFQQGIVLPQL